MALCQVGTLTMRRRGLHSLIHQGHGPFGHAQPRAQHQLLADAPHDARALGHAAERGRAARGRAGPGVSKGAGVVWGVGKDVKGRRA